MRNGSWRGGSIQSRPVAHSTAAIVERAAAVHRCDGGLCHQPFLGPLRPKLCHDVRLIPPICVKPFVKRQKNAAADAAAIAEATLHLNMHYVEVKSAEHRARAVAFRTHQCFVRQRTQLINALRGHLGEFGIIVAQGPANLIAIAGILADETK
ncbi:hypothetical protein [Rhizobium leguminosarum]|uniref:hypothetical protein n=1 Tax=Rhizobium leguminosarum TaxID=384 RepID=UPI0021BBD5FF|nr:hypothetical protein [Rhizobium leguminosarum]